MDLREPFNDLTERSKPVRGGVAVLVASDDLAEVVRLCDRSIVMRGGIMTGEIPGNELTTERLTNEIM